MEIRPNSPSSIRLFALWMNGMLRRCMPICTICFDRRTDYTISALCCRFNESGFS